MAESAITFDFPPPIKPEKIRLVLPDDDISEDLLDNQHETNAETESSTDLASLKLSDSADLALRNAELQEKELELIAREEAVRQSEANLLDRERNLWEWEALIIAREKLVDTQMEQLHQQKALPNEASEDELLALQQLRNEVERQQKNLEQTKQELKEREEFVEASESRLLEKTMLQQEEESRLEQMKEDLDARELRVNQLEGKPPPPKVEKEIL